MMKYKMKHYYALFKKTDEAIEVEFPDLQGCFTFGKDWEEALENAEDALAAWLVNAEPEFIKEPSKHHELERLCSGELIPILADEKVMASYRKLNCREKNTNQDSFFSDDNFYKGETPQNLSTHHDDYLY